MEFGVDIEVQARNIQEAIEIAQKKAFGSDGRMGIPPGEWRVEIENLRCRAV